MFLTFNHQKTQNRHQIRTWHTKPSYFRCNRFKLPRVTNCTQKDIRAIVWQINGQYRQISKKNTWEHSTFLSSSTQIPYFSLFCHSHRHIFRCMGCRLSWPHNEYNRILQQLYHQETSVLSGIQDTPCLPFCIRFRHNIHEEAYNSLGGFSYRIPSLDSCT